MTARRADGWPWWVLDRRRGGAPGPRAEVPTVGRTWGERSSEPSARRIGDEPGQIWVSSIDSGGRRIGATTRCRQAFVRSAGASPGCLIAGRARRGHCDARASIRGPSWSRRARFDGWRAHSRTQDPPDGGPVAVTPSWRTPRAAPLLWSGAGPASARRVGLRRGRTRGRRGGSRRRGRRCRRIPGSGPAA